LARSVAGGTGGGTGVGTGGGWANIMLNPRMSVSVQDHLGSLESFVIPLRRRRSAGAVPMACREPRPQ
jgi:hypothetical protein